MPLDDFAEESLVGGASRGWVEIVAKMLQTCERGALKTHIMFQSNLNSGQTAHYMRFLVENELIERVEYSLDRPIYRTSKKGIQYLKAYGKLENVFRQ